MSPAPQIRAFRTAQKPRRAFTKQRERFALTSALKQGARSAFTEPQPRERFAFTFAKPRGQNAFTWRGHSTVCSCRAVVPRLRDEGGFTLLELLVVMALIAIMMVLTAPAFTNLKSAGDVTNTAYTIKGVLEQARNYAMANNTYAYVGFYEEATTAATPTNSPPPYPGKGRIVLAIVASKDGTTSCEDPASTTSNRIPLTPSLITQVGKLVKIENSHVTDVGSPTPSPSTTPEASSLNARSSLPYTWASPADYENRINSDDTHAPTNQTLYPFVAQGYKFYKTIRFSPRGEADLNGSYKLRRVAEIGLKPTHGTTVDTNSRNVVAIQFGGTDGNFRIYRQ